MKGFLEWINTWKVFGWLVLGIGVGLLGIPWLFDPERLWVWLAWVFGWLLVGGIGWSWTDQIDIDQFTSLLGKRPGEETEPGKWGALKEAIKFWRGMIAAFLVAFAVAVVLDLMGWGQAAWTGLFYVFIGGSLLQIWYWRKTIPDVSLEEMEAELMEVRERLRELIWNRCGETGTDGGGI